ncbi:hypothetical protein ABT154_21595 [Streptomyces sp. NPDC001728]|jgi:hypothetical protein|uniref:hypothetical protein n=1 Tax=Streptomyces sp. NPDC001728 TaxID=3154396 RepID=UPI003326B49D
MSFRDRQERRCKREIAALRILADLHRWRADQRMREDRESLALCQTLYDLPAHQPARKETGQ